MRLPWGSLSDIAGTFLQSVDYAILGCLSYEERCCAVPKRLSSFSNNCKTIELLEIEDPDDAFPDHSVEAERKIEQNRQELKNARITFQSPEKKLMISDDGLNEIIDIYRGSKSPSTLILDISSLPKRYFCFFLKRMLKLRKFHNVIVTYTQTGPNGYTRDNLAEDPMTADHLPGFSGPLSGKDSTFVISVGFESLNISSLLDMYRDRKKGMKIILSFPPNGESTRRVWNTLRHISSEPEDMKQHERKVIAVWDTEHVYRTLNFWKQDAEELTFAPFGPKPHSLGMALFAIEHEAGMYYTQPKSYNPEYSTGQGNSWAYVVKWGGTPCYERKLDPI